MDVSPLAMVEAYVATKQTDAAQAASGNVGTQINLLA